MQKCDEIVDLAKFRMMKNEFLLVKIGFDTAENEPLRVGVGGS